MKLQENKKNNTKLFFRLSNRSNNGWPGTRNITLLETLGRRKYKYIPEVARKIIKEQIELGSSGLPWKNKKLYTDLMIKYSVKSYFHARDIFLNNEIIYL